jgi:hypothetical protein
MRLILPLASSLGCSQIGQPEQPNFARKEGLEHTAMTCLQHFCALPAAAQGANELCATGQGDRSHARLQLGTAPRVAERPDLDIGYVQLSRQIDRTELAVVRIAISSGVRGGLSVT